MTYRTSHTTHRIPHIFFCLLLLAGCARIVMPSGGPKDITPPKVVGEKPENGSVNFSGKTIKITLAIIVKIA
jgi:hypothetical protein